MNPETFESALHARLGRDFRLRWEPRTGAFSFEQKSHHGTYEIPVNYDDPAYERIRDGYSLIMEISPSPFMRCEECHGVIPLPTLKFAEVRCPWCLVKGEKVIHFAGYFPLSDRLLEYMERLSPKRGLDPVRERRARNDENDRVHARDYQNRSEAILGDTALKIVRNRWESVGYTGREKSLAKAS